ncbi:amylosucrase [Mariniblastus fucicola]|uniref:amylosucrase n=1 Tax=Mariniblastus fucicola TaxID=980251 RepID=UPI001FD188DF|nr:amylosucrase [Mariniblastus fucicola]
MELIQHDFVAELSETASEMEFRAALTLNRVWPRLEKSWRSSSQDVTALQRVFLERLQRHWYALFERLYSLYGQRFDFHFHVETMLESIVVAMLQRDSELVAMDQRREVEADWFQSESVVGAALYVDLFSGNLGRLRENISYFKQLGVTYLHLMPLFASPDGKSDGGYAISDYRAVDPRLGTVRELQQLASDLRKEGILLVLDFVFNHTSDEHVWAKQAQSGNREYKEFYFIFPDRTEPDQYEQHLREIFPTVRRGNFTWHDGMGRWVWTTFNSFQWDLNYHNPSVFRSMMQEMLFIANLGVDALRLDAVAFIWKEKGTNCENLPKAHTVIQAFNLFLKIAAPGLAFKSEAIVHPDEVVKYIGSDECQISYNPQLMALLWESLATQKVALLNQALSHRSRLPPQTSWVNYLRCHDDIGWTFDDDDAAKLGINAYDHRQFLNQFYTGRFKGSFARGVPFQENLETGDMRISGTLASLAGLEEALELKKPDLVQLAEGRIELLQGISMSIGGIPLIYLGEEWGMLNDYDFVTNPAKADDSRWIHRPKMDWSYVNGLCEVEGASFRSGKEEVHYRIFHRTQRLIELRKSQPALAGQEMELFETLNPHVLGFVRIRQGHRLVVLGNFSDQPQRVDGNCIRSTGFGRFFQDAIADEEVNASDVVEMAPYQLRWLIRQ